MARTGAAMVMFEVIGSFQAARLLTDAKAQMNILNAIVLNGLGGIFDAVQEITGQINGLIDATVPLAKEVAEARIQFDKFMGSTEGLDEVRQEIINIGLEFGFTADKALEAGAKMAQLKDIVGGPGAVATATEVGIKFALIGDMETQDAMKKLINLQQQTNFMFGGMTTAQIEAMGAEEKANLVRQNSMATLTKLNTVENKSAATMQQLTFIMNQFAAQAHLTGESIEDMAASAAILVESGEEMGKAGRALRMIYARLGANTKGNNDALKEFGVTVRDTTTGQLRPLSAIVADLSANFKNLTAEEQQNVAQLVAGNDHYVRFIKLVQGSERQQNLATMASLGLSDAQEEVNLKLEDQAIHLKKVEAALENTKSAMGDAFIPAQIKATKSQVSFNRALTTFYTMSGTQGENAFGFMVKGAMDSAFHFERVNKILGPMIESMLNLKSITVAIATQETILRSMQGEQLVNPNIYKDIADSTARSLHSVQAEFQVRSRNQELRKNTLFLTELENDSKELGNFNLEKELTMSQLLATHKTHIVDLEERKAAAIMTNANLEENYTNAIAKATQLTAQHLQQIETMAIANAQFSTEELAHLTAIAANRSHNLRMIRQEQELEKNIRLLRAEQIPGEMITVRLKGDLRKIAADTLVLSRNISQEEANALVKGKQKFEVAKNTYAFARLMSEAGKKNTQQLEKNAGLEKEMLTNVMLKIQQAKQLGMEEMKLSQVKDTLNSITAEEAMLYANIIPGKLTYDALTEKEAMLIAKLVQEVRELNIVNQDQVEILYQVITATMAHGDSMKATGILADGMQLKMMKLSGALGIASAGVTMFDDSTEGAKVSMMLMSPVMIMSSIQMMQMTAALVAKSGAEGGAVKTTITHTLVTEGLSAAMVKARIAASGFIATMGPMILGVGLLVGALYFLTNSAEDNSDSIIRMNDSLGESLTLLDDLENAGVKSSIEDIPQAVQTAFQAAGISIEQLTSGSFQDLDEAINSTKKTIKELAISAGDGSSIAQRAFQAQQDEAEKYLSVLKAQQMLMQANLVLEGDIVAARDIATRLSLENAQSALEQLTSDTNLVNLYEDSIGMGGDKEFVAAAKNSARDATAAIFKAFEEEKGMEFTPDHLENLIELLNDSSFSSMVGEGGTGRGRLSHTAQSGLSGDEVEEFSEFIQMLGFTQEQLHMLQKAFDDSGNASEESVDAVMDAMSNLDFQFTTQEAQLLVDVLGGVGDVTVDSMGTASDALAQLGDELFEFNNNREAMFFGMSQAGVTGEFVKQVQQKGVENLIANTELIVTNNFNGMSLPEMVSAVTNGVVEMLTEQGIVEQGAVTLA